VPEKKKPRVAVGIDLGTSASTVACVVGAGVPTVVATPEGGRDTPSAVFFGRRGEVLVGKAALLPGELRPEGLFTHWKRHLSNPAFSRDVGERKVTALLLASVLLRKLVANVKLPVREAVVAVPTLFGDLERGALLDAARIAGIDSPRLLNEPTAAALDLALDPAHAGLKRILVYSLGATTFGATLVELESGWVRVLASGGERALGGRDWDEALLDLVAEEVYEKSGSDPREDPTVLAGLRARMEPAKLALSTESRVVIDAPLVGARRTLPITITRDAFDARTRGLLERTEAQLELVAERAGRALTDVDAVLAVGRATRMPMVASLLARLTKREPLAVREPEDSIARGAALYGAFFTGGLSLDLELGRDHVAQEAAPVNTGRPAAESGRLAPVDWGDESEEELPMLPGAAGPKQVRDVVANALGVLVFGKTGPRNSVVIPAQTEVPVERRKTFVTFQDGQKRVQVKVLEGDAKDPRRCLLVGTLVVDGLPEGRAKGQAIEIAYSYDADSRVQVSARDLATGKEARATIERRGALPASEITRLRDELARQVPT
jgi:molecular chaperone DnaK